MIRERDGADKQVVVDVEQTAVAAKPSGHRLEMIAAGH